MNTYRMVGLHGSLTALPGWAAAGAPFLLLASLMASITPAASQQGTQQPGGPFDVPARCPSPDADRVPFLPALPDRTMARYSACVSKYNTDLAVRQATSWIKDWFDATDCVDSCNNVEIGGIANTSTWKSLRYILALGLPDEKSDANCQRLQRNIAAVLDERMNYIAGLPVVATADCRARKATDATRKSIERIKEQQIKVLDKLNSWENGHK